MASPSPSTPSSNSLTIPVAELVRRPGSRRRVTTEVPADGLALTEASVPDGTPVAVDVVLEAMADGVTVSGTVQATWEAVCRRCLGPATGTVVADVEELYQQVVVSEDAFPFDGDVLDLGPMMRETVLVELPVAPLCRTDCAGLCPQCGNDRNRADCGHAQTATDLRWGALDALRDQLGNDS